MDKNPTSNNKGRIPPQAVDVEEKVLGTMFLELDAALTAFEMMDAEDFYKPAHRHIFNAMMHLFMDDKEIDFMLVENELRDNNLLEACGGPGYLSSLLMQSASAANIDYYCAILIEKSKRRQLILACNDIINESYRTDNDTYDVLDKAEHRLFEVNQKKQTSEEVHISEFLDKYLSDISEVMEDPEKRIGMLTGTDIDHLIPGFKPGQFIIIAARPSMGKTALELTLSNFIAAGRGGQERKVAIFSMEMGVLELVGRFITMEAHVSGQQAEKGKITDDEFKRMIDASGRLFNRNIWVDDTAGLSLIDLRSKVRKLVKKHGVEIVFVDYLQLMSANVDGNREQEISTISRGMKIIAKTYGVPVIALSQLSRDVEKRGGERRPVLSDLRESGSLEQDSDIVMFLYRPEYYDIKTTPEGESTEGLAEVLVRKHRGGPTGMIPMRFIKEYAVFENMAFNKQEPQTPPIQHWQDDTDYGKKEFDDIDDELPF